MTDHTDIPNAAPRTLAEAHQARSRLWPGGMSSPAAFAEYYQRGAALYEAVVETDSGHRYEATWWAQEYRRLAEEYEIQAYTAKFPSGPEGSTPGQSAGTG